MRWQSLRLGRVASYTADISGRSASLSSVIGIAKSCLAAVSSSCTISNSSTWRVTFQPGGGDSGAAEKSPTGTRASRASDSQACGICNASAPCTAISGGKRRAMPSTRAICDWCVVSAVHAGLSRGCIGFVNGGHSLQVESYKVFPEGIATRHEPMNRIRQRLLQLGEDVVRLLQAYPLGEGNCPAFP